MNKDVMDCNEKYHFTQSRVYIFITRNGGKLYLIAVLIMIATALIGFEKTFQFYRLFYVLFVLGTAVFLTGYFLRKVACEIIIDFDSNRLIFYTCRGEKATFSFNDILEIQVGRNVIFIMKEKKMYYNGIQNKKLTNCLERIQDRLRQTSKASI